MKPINDGGPAFPVIPSEYEVEGGGILGWTVTASDETLPTGLTVRAYFAGCALTGICANPASNNSTSDEIAIAAFGLADAMIAEEPKAGEES